MADHFYLEAARRQYDDLEAQKAQELANLSQAKAMSDHGSAEIALQSLANIQANQRNLAQLTAEYVQGQQPPQQVPQSREEWQAKPIDRMTPADGLEVIRSGSKYGKDLDFRDPNVIAGWNEAQRRRARGGIRCSTATPST